MNRRRKDVSRVELDNNLEIEFHGTKVTGNRCFFTRQGLDEDFKLTTMMEF
jgi:hypothetical protein